MTAPRMLRRTLARIREARPQLRPPGIANRSRPMAMDGCPEARSDHLLRNAGRLLLG
jgi:hypothetical protein